MGCGVLVEKPMADTVADCEAMNAVWDAWVPPGSAPARACVKVAGLVDPGWRIEIALSAAR